MKSPSEWFAAYDLYHTHPTNKLLHAVGIPLIMFGLIGLLSVVPTPSILPRQITILSIIVGAVTVYYFLMAWRLGCMMLALLMALMAGNHLLASWLPGYYTATSTALFVIGWGSQFLGHQYEGKRPAFLNDLQFLLIGPAWLMARLGKRAGIEI
jgi:uncharacterized membrane protein YGL010W